MAKSLSPAQKENTRHGERFFPVQRYRAVLDPAHPCVTLHWHEEAELTLITGGLCVYQIDLTDYEANEGDLIFVAPQLLHGVTLKSERFTSETYVFHLSFLGGNATDLCATRYLAPLANQELSVPCRIPPTHPSYCTLLDCFRQTADCYAAQKFGYELAVKAALLNALFLLLQDSGEPAPGNTSSDKLKGVLDYLELHYAEPVTVAQLAQLCYFSPYHFMRFFKKHMNMTCTEYINTLRLEKAVARFEEGNTSILEVSTAVGFHNLSYFHKLFKKKYRMTPLSFIRALSSPAPGISEPPG